MSARPANMDRYYAGLCAAAFLLAWLPHLGWGFWVDEAGTFWMACEGWRSAVDRCTQWPGQSILYGVVQSFFCKPGPYQEMLLRVTSLVAAAAACYFLYRLAEALIGSRSGWPCVAFFVCAPPMVLFGTQARPYAPALAASLAAFWYLDRWVETRRTTALALYGLAGALTVHLHYLFAFVFGVHLAYLWLCAKDGKTIAWRRLVMVWMAVALSLAPLWEHLRLLWKPAPALSRAVPPTFTQLLSLCFPPAVLLGAVLAVIVLAVLYPKPLWRKSSLRAGGLSLLILWATAGPVLFFCAARWGGQSVFASRYLLFALPASLLLLTWAAASLREERARFLMVLGVFAGAVLHPAQLQQSFGGSQLEWRAPLRLAAELSRGDDRPLFVQSGLAESNTLDWRAGPHPGSYLFAPLTAYPVKNRVLPLPYFLTDDVQRYIRDTARLGLAACPRFLLLAKADSEVAKWMLGEFAAAGFDCRRHNVNDLAVVAFERKR